MDKFSAMVKAQKAVLNRFGTSVGPESEAAYKRYYCYYRSPNHALATHKEELAELERAPFYNRFSSNALAR